MTETGVPPSRADRLAARLRDNLHKRKAQARALNGRAGPAADNASGDAKSDLPKSGDGR